MWNAAKTTYHSGDFRKTSENLIQLIRSESEFTARARPWSTVISAGLAQGYADMAESYDAGAKMNRANPTPFRKQASMLRSLASASALEFAEGVHQFTALDQNPEVVLACEYPMGSMTEPAGLRKIASGMLMQDSERELLEKAMLQRGVLLSMSRVLGSYEDAAKTLDQFKTGEAKVARGTFLMGTAQHLYDLSALYGTQKLDQPNRLQLMCREALEALKGVPETKESKALTGKINAALKKAKGTT